MADLISSLTEGGVSGIADAFAKIVAVFKLTPEQKATIEAAAAANTEKMAELDQQYKIKIIDADTAANTTAGETIRAELNSPDPWVRRAAVSTIWLGFFVGVWNWIIMPTAHIWAKGAEAFSLPTPFWYLWAVAIVGFVGGNAALRALAGAGGTLNLLGIKMDSKGD